MLVIYHCEEGSWWAESPDLPAFSAVAEDLRTLRKRVKEGIEYYTGSEAELEEQQVDGTPVRDLRIIGSGLASTAGLAMDPFWPTSRSSTPLTASMHTTKRRSVVTPREPMNA